MNNHDLAVVRGPEVAIVLGTVQVQEAHGTLEQMKLPPQHRLPVVVLEDLLQVAGPSPPILNDDGPAMVVLGDVVRDEAEVSKTLWKPECRAVRRPLVESAVPPKSVLEHVSKLTDLATRRPPELAEDISRRDVLDRLQLHAPDGIESAADVLDLVQHLLQQLKYLDALLLGRVPAPQEDLGPGPG